MSFRIAVDTGGTFSDVVLADDEGHFSLSKAPTTPGKIFDGISQALEFAASRARARPARAAGADRRPDLRDHAFDERHHHGHDGAHGADHDRGVPGHTRLPRGRQAAAVRLPPALSRAVHPEAADVRDAGADLVRGRRRARADGGRRRRRAARGRGRRRGGDRRLPAVVDRQPRARGADRLADRARAARRAVHALGTSEPDHPRIPAYVVGRHRRVAQAPHAGPPE